MALFLNPEKEYEKSRDLVREMLNARADGQREKEKKLSEKAVAHLRKAAEGGHAKAMYHMAVYAACGSVEAQILTFPSWENSAMLFWLQKSADAGYLYGIRDLGVYYYLHARPKDPAKAEALLVRAYGMDRAAAFADLISLYTDQGNTKRLTELLDGVCPGTESDLRCWPYTRQLADLRREQGREDCRPLYQILASIPDRHSLLRLGEMEAAEGNDAGAVEYYKKAYLSADANLAPAFPFSPKKEEFYQWALRRKGTSYEALLKRQEETPEARLSHCASKGKGITREELFQWYKSVADGGNLPAKYEVAIRFLIGNGVAKNESAGIAVLKELKNSGKAPRHALVRLGNLYMERKQYNDALDCFSVVEKAPFDILHPVDYSLNYTRCLYETKNFSAALPRLEAYVKNTADKDPWAVHTLGLCYLNGWGTPLKPVPNTLTVQPARETEKAVALFREGAKMGHAPCWNSLGYCYQTGSGVGKNGAEGIRCYQKAFELDPKFAKAAYNLGVSYENGDGVKRDTALARQWYEKAAKLGHKVSESRIGVLDAAAKLQEEIKKNPPQRPAQTAPAPKAKSQTPRTSSSVRKESYNARKELDSLIGLESVKKEIEMLEAVIKGNALRRSQGLPEINVSLNMIFTGNAGTGKTTVARIVANILKENGLLTTGQLVETDRGGLVGQYIGDTAPKTTQKVQEAIGGVLFIDEAYALAPADGGRDYGPEAVSTLIKLMEDRKGEFAVIIAGYEEEMKHFIDSNSGLKSRFPTVIHFPDYTPGEMQMIFDRMSEKGNYIVSDAAREKLMALWQASADYSNLGNGRAVRNVYEKVQKMQLLRILRENVTSGERLRTFDAADIPVAEEVFN